VNWTPDAYDRLERALADGSRVQIYRRGTEFVIVPLRIRTDFGAEILVSRHPVTGDRVEFPLDEVDGFVVLD
jgi:virulence-associated protein VagC